MYTHPDEPIASENVALARMLSPENYDSYIKAMERANDDIANFFIKVVKFPFLAFYYPIKKIIVKCRKSKSQ